MLPVTTLVINVSSVALIWFGGLRIDAGHMQVGSLIAFLSYFMQILMAVLLATFLLILLPRASVCAERITEVLSTTAAITSPEDPVRPDDVKGVIRLEAATFNYPGADRPVLQDVSLTARPGTTTAVVGSTGSGKSTLVSLICRLYDVTAGSVSVSTTLMFVTTTPSSCGRRSDWCHNAATCSPERSPTTCATARPTPPTTRCGRRCGWRRRTASSAHTPTVWQCPSPRAASTSPAVSGNGWPSRGR